MSGSSPAPGSMGLVGPNDLGSFASADFADADDVRPLGAIFDIGGHGSPTPYTAAVGAMVRKHMDEIKGKVQAAAPPPTNWKKKLREFLSAKNTELLDYLNLKVKTHSTLGPGEALLRRFGNPSVNPGHPTVKEFILDASGSVTQILERLNLRLEELRSEPSTPLKDMMAWMQVLYDEYRNAGDRILQQQTLLKAKLDRLDRMQGRITSLFEIEPNEAYDPLMEASEAYLKRLFESSQIEPEYKALMEAYREFAVLRDAVTMSRAIVGSETEPVCSICLHESVTHALTPCGHTFCQTCVLRQNGTCFYCRTAIREKVRLYFG
jgi:hypothetical protein